MARLVAARNPPVFPELSRDYLLQSLEASLKSSSQSYPRLKCIQDGHAIFESNFRAQYTSNCKINYRIICRIPLTDPLFQTDQTVEYLRYRQAAPWANFVPDGYYDNKGYGLSGPI